MERRKILLGSGATLAAVLAGCTSTETDDESSDDDDDDTGFDDSNGSDASEDDGSEDDESDIPGVDDEMPVESDNMSVVDTDHDSGTLDVVVETETTDTVTLENELKHTAEDLAYGIDDMEAFEADIDRVELAVEYDGSLLYSAYVETEWLIEYRDDVITQDELGAKVLATKE